MAELTEPQKLEIVTRLARFEAPMDIVKDFGERGITTNAVQIGSYDPTRTYFEAGDKWREVFDAARKSYLEDVASVPVANQSHRLQLLNKGIELAVSRNKWDLAAKLIEQASKEVGGAYSNVRELNLNDSRGKARDLSPDDRKAMLADLIRQAVDTMPTPPGAEPPHPTAQ